MYMMSLKSQITPIATAVVDGIQGTLGRLTATNNQTQTKDTATITNPVLAPVPPTKGPKFERMLDLGVIEEDEEIDEDAESASNASGTSESPAAMVTSNPVKSFQSTPLPNGPVNITEVNPDDDPTTVHLSTVAETHTGIKNVGDQFRGTKPPSSIDIAIMRVRMTRAPCIPSMLNPASEGGRFLPPVVRRRAEKNPILLLALGNYAYHQAVKATEAAIARRQAMEQAMALAMAQAQDEYNEQFQLAPPDEHDDLMAEYIDFDAMADAMAERQAKAYTMCDMDDDDYY